MPWTHVWCPTAAHLLLLLLVLDAQVLLEANVHSGLGGHSLLILRRKEGEAGGGLPSHPELVVDACRAGVPPRTVVPLACIPEGCFPDRSGLGTGLLGRWAGRKGEETGLESWRLTWGHTAGRGWHGTRAKATDC